MTKTNEAESTIYQEDPFHLWFNLTYASYLVLPRLILESMPCRWQLKMIALINQIEETLDLGKDGFPDYRVNAVKNGKFIKDIYSNYRRSPKVKRKDNDQGLKE